MKTAGYLTILTLLLACFAVSASAQRTRRTTPRSTPKPKPTPVRTSAITPEVSAAKLQVSNQLHNVTVFVDVYGTVAIGIEDKEKQAAARRLDKKGLEDHDLNKRKTIAAIRGLRDGLVALETDFRTKPQLAAYLLKIQGISTLAAQSEDSAIAGRFVAAKDPLRQIALKLNETLAVLPGPMPAGTTLPAASRATPSPAQTRPVSANTGRPVTSSPPNTSNGTRTPALGMTANEVMQSSWGAPVNKRTSTTPNGTTEVWTYSGNRSVYFYNGKVSNVVQ